MLTYHQNKNFYHVEIVRKKGFDGCKSKIFVIGDKNAGRGDRTAKARRCSVRHGDDFDWQGGHSENQGGTSLLRSVARPRGCSSPLHSINLFSVGKNWFSS